MTSVEIVSTLFGVNWLDSLLISTAVFTGGMGPDLEDPRVVLGSVLLLEERVLPLLLPRERLLSVGVTPPGGTLDNAIRSIRERDVFSSPKDTLKPDKLSDT
jgi:hypothetical protein